MPVELDAFLIKSGNNKHRPSIKSFPISNSTLSTTEILNRVDAAYPGTTSADEGAILSPKDAFNLLSRWRKEISNPAGSLRLPQAFAESISEMIDLAKSGHSLMLAVD
jgi:hypothetical protein